MAVERSITHMSREYENLHNNVRVGFTGKRGNAWWNSRGMSGMTDDGKPNHFDGPVPIESVRDLFNFEAKALPLYVPDLDPANDGAFVKVDGRIAIARSDTGYVMGVFKDGYVIHQYDEWLMNSIANILDDDLQIGSAGLLQNGAVGWVSCEVPENIVTPEGVEFRPFIFGLTSMNGFYATQFGRCNTNIVCDNTLDWAARGEKGMRVKVKHTKNSGFRIQSTRDALGIIHSGIEETKEAISELAKVKVTDKAFSKFLDLWSPIPQDTPEKEANKRAVTLSENRRAILTNLWKNDDRVTPWKNTGLGIVQAVNTFDQHFSSVHAPGADDSGKAFARWERSILGAANGDLNARTSDVKEMLAAVTK
jgi:phage/plasmid-like protein (TIGR03299 family)